MLACILYFHRPPFVSSYTYCSKRTSDLKKVMKLEVAAWWSTMETPAFCKHRETDRLYEYMNVVHIWARWPLCARVCVCVCARVCVCVHVTWKLWSTATLHSTKARSFHNLLVCRSSPILWATGCGSVEKYQAGQRVHICTCTCITCTCVYCIALESGWRNLWKSWCDLPKFHQSKFTHLKICTNSITHTW